MKHHEITNDDERFDRLVDGELSPHEYRRMLASLDGEPGGWRRCALAFVEAQALTRELGALRDEAVSGEAASGEAASGEARAANDARNDARRRAGFSQVNDTTLVLAMAACFAIAFGLGVAARTPWSEDNRPAKMVAEDAPAAPSEPSGGESASPPPSRLAGSRTDEPRRAPGNAGAEELPTLQPLQNVTLVVGGDGTETQRIELPVVDFGEFGEQYLRQRRSALPPEVREMLRRSGHRLQRTERLVPLEMQDGQQVVVPVEEVEIVPVGLPAL